MNHIDVNSLDLPLTWEQAEDLLGKTCLLDGRLGTIIGVDRRPPKKQTGIYLVVSFRGQPNEYFNVDPYSHT